MLKNGDLVIVHKLTCSICFHQPPRRIRSLPWQHDLLEDSIRAAGITGAEGGAKLYVSNLDYGVSNEDIRVQLKAKHFHVGSYVQCISKTFFSEIQELFSEIGGLKRYAVHYDKNGRPSVSSMCCNFLRLPAMLYLNDLFWKGLLTFEACLQGSAEVVYTRRSDAFAAFKKYNNVLLDGKPMKIEIMGTSAEMPFSARVNVTGINGRRKRTVVMTYVI